MSNEEDECLHAELSLLETMYPDQVVFDEKAREVKYSSDKGSFHLRLPNGYLVDELPEVLAASFGRRDLREQLKHSVRGCDSGVEVLDAIISSFNEILELCLAPPSGEDHGEPKPVSHEDSSKVTIVVWLHHLLNTNKRKQALSPPSPGVSGVTKPGYPGVLIYSGPASAVHEHVNELKQLSWQAFQVRLEQDKEWLFTHGKGIKEVETMKEIVAEVGEEKRELFMEAMRIK